MSLFEQLFHKHFDELILSHTQNLITPKIDISFEFAEYIYQMLITNQSEKIQSQLKFFWQRLQKTQVYTEEFIRSNPDRKWDYYLFSNENLSTEFFIELFPSINFSLVHIEHYLHILSKNKNVDYLRFCEHFDINPLLTLDDYLNYNQTSAIGALPDFLTFEDYSAKYRELIKYVNLYEYEHKFGRKKLKRFIKKYNSILMKNYYQIEIYNDIDVYKYLYCNKEDVEIKYISPEIYKCYPKIFSQIRPPLNPYMTVKKLIRDKRATLYDYHNYAHNRLTREDIEYLLRTGNYQTDVSIKVDGKFTIDWKKLVVDNKRFSYTFLKNILEKYNIKYDAKYLNNTYSMEDYESGVIKDICKISRPTVDFLRKHIEVYKQQNRIDLNNFLLMDEEHRDEIFEEIVNSGIDLNKLETIYGFSDIINKKIIYKYLKVIPKKLRAFFLTKTDNNFEAVNYFPILYQFSNKVNIFDRGVYQTKKMIFIFNKWIPIEGVLKILDDRENCEIPLEIIEMILMMV